MNTTNRPREIPLRRNVVTRQLAICPESIRCVAARSYPHQGRRSVPQYVVDQMHADYRRLGSLARTAILYRRTKQDLAFIFRARGLAVKPRGGDNRSPNSRVSGNSSLPLTQAAAHAATGVCHQICARQD